MDKKVVWKNFRLDDLFVIEGTKSLDAGSISFVDNGINFVGRTNDNNGIQGKISAQAFKPNKANTITVTVIGNYKYVKLQEQPYYCSQNINKLTIKDCFKNDFNCYNARYLITHIKKFVEQYNGQQSGYKLDDIKKHIIVLPVKEDGTPDWDYMAERIKELEAERIKELEAYLIASELDDFRLTEEDKEVLENFGNVRWKEFRLGDLFDIHASVKKFNANEVSFDGTYPYVARGTSNNGIRGYITEDIKYLNPANTLSFGQDTATVYYQDKAYFTGDKIKIMELKKYDLTEEIASFLLPVIRKAFSGFAWGQNSFNEKLLNNVKIFLPVEDDGQPDWNYMERYIRATEKLVIADVVKWKDQQIKVTKNVVNKGIA